MIEWLLAVIANAIITTTIAYSHGFGWLRERVPLSTLGCSYCLAHWTAILWLIWLPHVELGFPWYVAWVANWALVVFATYLVNALLYSLFPFSALFGRSH